MPNNKLCSNCRFSEENESGMECHLYPPKNRIVQVPPSVISQDPTPQLAVDVFFPRTMPNLSCGQWQPVIKAVQ